VIQSADNVIVSQILLEEPVTNLNLDIMTSLIQKNVIAMVKDLSLLNVMKKQENVLAYQNTLLEINVQNVLPNFTDSQTAKPVHVIPWDLETTCVMSYLDFVFAKKILLVKIVTNVSMDTLAFQTVKHACVMTKVQSITCVKTPQANVLVDQILLETDVINVKRVSLLSLGVKLATVMKKVPEILLAMTIQANVFAKPM